MGATSYEQEPPQPHDDSGDDSDKNYYINGILIYLALCAFIGFHITLAVVIKDPPKYSVAIAGASGLELDSSAADHPVEFNVTLRVTSRSVWDDEACLDPATSVRVSYLGVPLAGCRVHPRLCAPTKQHADLAVAARGEAVPGYLLDSLAEDMRTGRAVFEVTLMSPHGSYGRKVRTCWGRIGDAATLEDACVESRYH